MDIQRFGNWVVTWVVEEEDNDGNPIFFRRYYDAKKAAEFSIGCENGGVRMELVKPEWGVKTQD